MLFKDKCVDIFKNTIIYDKDGNPIRMHEAKSHKQYVDDKL